MRQRSNLYDVFLFGQTESLCLESPSTDDLIRKIIFLQPYPFQIPLRESILPSRRLYLSSRDCLSLFPILYHSSSLEMKQKGMFTIYLYQWYRRKGRCTSHGPSSHLAFSYNILLSAAAFMPTTLFSLTIYMTSIANFSYVFLLVGWI